MLQKCVSVRSLIIPCCVMSNVLITLSSYFSHRPAFGNFNSSQNAFVYTSYADLYKTVKQFASGLRYMMKEDWTPMVAICSTTRLEWYITDIACMFLGITTVG